MTDGDAVLEALRAVVARVAGTRRAPPVTPGADTPLGEGGWWLDSLELLEVVVACEAEFGIVFEPGRDLLGGALDTLGTLAALIRSKAPPTSSATAGG